jgi:hypothetical protein
VSSSAEADDPVIAGRLDVRGFGLETHLHLLLDARFRGHDSGEIMAPGKVYFALAA